MELAQLKNILEAILLTADQPMEMRKLEALFEADEEQCPSSDLILQALSALQEDYQGRGIELKEVASGYRMQVVPECANWVSRMWEEKAPRYSRALLETLVLIAYRQPITRGEIEEIRGVSVSSHIVKTLSEREWVRVLGHKDVPGRPSMYGTTREFLDYFNLKSLDDLPSLADLKDLDKLNPELALEQEVAAEGEEKSAGEEERVVSSDSVEGTEQESQESTDADADELLNSDESQVSTDNELSEDDQLDAEDTAKRGEMAVEVEESSDLSELDKAEDEGTTTVE